MPRDANSGAMAHEALAPASGPSERPRHGDLLIVQDATRPHRYSVSQIPGTPQVSGEREEAVALASDYARLHSLDAWTIEGTMTSRVASHRRRVPGGRHP